MLCLTTKTWADESTAYCRRIDALAASEGALLWAPKLSVQGLRYPSGFDNGPTTPQGYQLRVGFSYSLVDLYRALQVSDVNQADCAAHTLEGELETATQTLAESPLRFAYQAQALYLSERRRDVDAIVARARERLKDHVITISEFNELLDSADQLERKAIQAEGSAARIDLKHGPALSSPHSPESMSQDLMRLRSEHEQRLSTLRALDAWSLRVQGGLIPVAERGVEWYGWVELSYSLGGLFRSHAEERFRLARLQELRDDPDQLPQRIQRVRDDLASQAKQAHDELRVVARRLDQLKSAESELDAANDALAAHLRDALALQELSASAERAFLETLIASTQEGSRQRD